MLMRRTNIYTTTECPTHTLHHRRSAPARRQRARPPHISSDKQIYAHRQHQHNPKHTANTILGTTPLSTNTEREVHLPRDDRINVSRFCCGHHTDIINDMHRIDQASNADSPHCSSGEGTIEHLLLHCPTFQKHRDLYYIHSLEHLWEHPKETVALFGDASII